METTELSYGELYELADKAGKAAAEAKTPTPMHLRGYEPIADGVCGFAWVHVRDARTSFAKWLASEHSAHSGYYGGVELWISDYQQSYELKLAYAEAFAESLRRNGDIDAYANSRLD
jgi:hypothetical protein